MGSFRYYVGLAGLIWYSAVQAENLTEVYRLAVQSDPTLQQAFATLQANRQQFPLALAQMVPNLSANYATTGNRASQDSPSPFVPEGGYNTQTYGITLNQPIYHPEHWAQLAQSRHIVKSAEASYLSAAQNLIIRVTQQYFNILGAIDDLDFARGQTIAFSREYEQAKQRFDVGLIAITDVESAKAQFDNARATEISAENAVSDQYEELRKIVGQPIKHVALFPTTTPLKLLPPSPNQQEQWVDTANLYNLDVIAAKENAYQLKSAIGVQVAGHFPKVDVSANVERVKSAPPFEDLIINRSVTLNVSLPIFSGGSAIFNTKQATARYQEAKEQLEGQQRLADANTREAFRGVLTAISRVDALAQAVISNESSVKSTKAAYEVGTRTIVEVLSAESSLLGAKRDHAKSRYDYLLQGLKLKQAAGTLTSEDLYSVTHTMAGE